MAFAELKSLLSKYKLSVPDSFDVAIMPWGLRLRLRIPESLILAFLRAPLLREYI